MVAYPLFIASRFDFLGNHSWLLKV